MKNTLGISKVYLKFFVKNNRSRWIIMQGSRRSGKTWNICKWLHFLASGKPKTIGIIAATYPALTNTMNDFKLATGLNITGSLMDGFKCEISNGSKFLFRAYETPERAQGTRYDTVFIDEALNIDEKIIAVLSMSVSESIFCAYNPTRTSYLEKYILPDRSNFLLTTYRDNAENLTPEMIKEFEDIKARSLLPTATLFDVYAAKVYCDGEFGEMSGRVFKFVHTISDEEYEKIPAPEMYGLDFGFTENEQSDATALAGVKIWDGGLYMKQYIYSTQLASNKELAFRMADIGLDVYSPIACDYGGMGSSRIKALVTAENCTWHEPQISRGFSVQNAVKGKIIEGLQRMNQYTLYVTSSSTELRREMDNYELTAEGKPKRGCADHCLDACRYACNSYYNNFEIQC